MHTGFYQSCRSAISAEIHGKIYPDLRFRNHRQTCRKPILMFPKCVFTSQRKKKSPKSLEHQTNKITDYLSAKFDATSIVTDVLELIDLCNPVYCAARQILNELVTYFETESSHHSGENISEKTIKSWTKRYHTYEIFSYIFWGTIYSITQP